MSSLTVNLLVEKLKSNINDLEKVYLLFDPRNVKETKNKYTQADIIGLVTVSKGKNGVAMKYKKIIEMCNGKLYITFKENANHRKVNKTKKHQVLAVLVGEQKTFTAKDTGEEVMYYESQITEVPAQIVTKLVNDKKEYDENLLKEFQLNDLEDI